LSFQAYADLSVEQLEDRNMPGDPPQALAVPLGPTPLADMYNAECYALAGDSPSASTTWSDSAVAETSALGNSDTELFASFG